MSKACERAKERYWLEPCNIDIQNKYHAYIEGYEQAEKDLKLSWEDMRKLYIIFAEVDTEIKFCKSDVIIETLGYYQEVLRRFKEIWKKNHCTE